MHSWLLCAVSVGFFTRFLAFGVERPRLPDPQPDRELLEQIAKSQADESCRRELQLATRTYLEEKLKLTSSPTDAQEDKMRAARERMLDWMDKCGHCRSRPMKATRLPTPARTENWYLSDGSCKIDESLAPLRTAFERGTEIIHNVKTYAAYNGGFTNVLEFAPYPEADSDTLNDTYYAFIAVPAFRPLIFRRAFSYFYKGVSQRESDHTYIHFKNHPMPEGYAPPKVFIKRASGKKIELVQNSPVRLIAVEGMWYLNSDGVIRYATLGDFSLDIGESMAQKLGRMVLLETVVELSERMLVSQ